MDDASPEPTAKAQEAVGQQPEKASAARREIPGKLTYTTTPGSLKSVLDAMIKAEVPDKVSKNFVATVLGLKGGSAAQQIPVLKRLGLVSTEGVPTERYYKFRSDGGRSQAALEALRNGFQTIFQKNEFAFRLSESEVKDLAAEITGLKKNDPVLGYIVATFERVRGFITDRNVAVDSKVDDATTVTREEIIPPRGDRVELPLGLVYNINIVLPQSNSIETYNMIFRSLRENILDWSR